MKGITSNVDGYLMKYKSWRTIYRQVAYTEMNAICCWLNLNDKFG